MLPGAGSGLLLTRPVGPRAFAPVRVAEVELSGPVPGLRALSGPVRSAAADAVTTGSFAVGNHRPHPVAPPVPLYCAAHLLVRLHGEPLGVVLVDLTAGDATPETVLAAVRNELGDRIDAHLRADALPPAPATLPVTGLPAGGDGTACRRDFAFGADAALVSVVIPTRGRTPQLLRCLDSVLRSDHPSFEVLVVDNGPGDPATRDAVAAAHGHDPRVRYLAEPAPGASQARNTGIAAAAGRIIAFTDDDVVVDEGWLSGIAGAFARDPEAGCVAGLTHPLELETPGQVWFERIAGFSRGHLRRTLTMHEQEPPTVLYPYTAGVFGASNNLAVRAKTLRAVGGFDTRLGPATLPAGGEDIDLCLRIVLAGGSVVHEPRALVRHDHRRDVAEVVKQLYTYGTGTTAVLMKHWLIDARLRRLVLRRLVSAIHALEADPAGNVSDQWPTLEPLPALGRASLRGQLTGPLLWIRQSRRSAVTGAVDEVRRLIPDPRGADRGHDDDRLSRPGRPRPARPAFARR